MSKVILRGQWTPTQEERDRMRTFPKPDIKGRPVFFIPGREPYVSLILTGEASTGDIEAGQRYFIDCRGSTIKDQPRFPEKNGRLRRTVWVFPWLDFNSEDEPVVSLDYLTRPLSIVEAWRAARGEAALYREYPDGSKDFVMSGEKKGWGYRPSQERDRVQLNLREHQAWYIPGELGIQETVDRLDMMITDIERPDWRLKR